MRGLGHYFRVGAHFFLLHERPVQDEPGRHTATTILAVIHCYARVSSSSAIGVEKGDKGGFSHCHSMHARYSDYEPSRLQSLQR